MFERLPPPASTPPAARFLAAAMAPGPAATPASAYENSTAYVELKVRMHRKLIGMINLAAIEQLEPADFRAQFSDIVTEVLAGEQIPLNGAERARLATDILDEFMGLGPIEPLLKDSTVTDILVNTYRHVYVERRGRLEPTEVRFKDNGHLLRIIDKIVSRVGRRIDESCPMVDARLADGSRINAVVAPIAVDGPVLSIRKFSEKPYSLEHLANFGSLTTEMASVLAALVKCRFNILISGGTGSGKTTLLNAMSRYIGEQERIVTIEDAAELRLQQTHVVRLETRPSNVEGQGEIMQRDLVKNALRMRPDRIIVGEARGAEAFDMLQAMNTGHDGSMTTIHANTCRDALGRVEQMISIAGLDLPIRSIRAQIASALDVVVQLSRFSDGVRRVASIQEITGMEGDVIAMQEIFEFRQRSVDAEGRVLGAFAATGVRPMFIERLAVQGVHLSMSPPAAG
jgi:pilus assembly protein CpaF